MMFKLTILPVALLAAADTARLDIDAGRPLAATVHGISAKLVVDPGAPSIPVFNPEFATRAGFKSGMFGTNAAVGPVRIAGKSAVVRLDYGAGEFKRRVTWFAARMTAEGDGVIGPGGIPADIVRFTLHPATAGERSVTLPLADFGMSGMGVEISLAGATIQTRFELDRARSIATAGAGALLARAQGGGFDAAPETMVINLGIERPVRRLALGQPLAVGPIALASVMVRTGDFGSVAGIADRQAPEADPDEIVVTGGKKAKPRLRLALGRDYLDSCSSIVFDKSTKTVTLSCR